MEPCWKVWCHTVIANLLSISIFALYSFILMLNFDKYWFYTSSISNYNEGFNIFPALLQTSWTNVWKYMIIIITLIILSKFLPEDLLPENIFFFLIFQNLTLTIFATALRLRSMTFNSVSPIGQNKHEKFHWPTLKSENFINLWLLAESRYFPSMLSKAKTTQIVEG